MLRLILKLGLIDGLLYWFSTKKPGKPGVHFPGFNSKIFWRRNGSDIVTLGEIFLEKQYEMPDIPLHSVKFIIDAGSNIGISAMYFSKKYPDAKVLAIEPESENFKFLKKNTSTYDNIIPFHGALWYCDTTLEVIDQGLGVRGFCVSDSPKENLQMGNIVSSKSVEKIMKEYNLQVIDIFKIDIEGGEKELFQNNTEWIKNTRCIIIELHDRINPECSKVFFEAIKFIPYRMEIRGENIFIFNLNLLKID